MLSRYRRLPFLALVIGLLSCATDPRLLSAKVEAEHVVLLNDSGADVYFSLFDQEALALADIAASPALTNLAICESPSACANARIAPHSSRAIPFESIGAYSATTRLVRVDEWRFVPDGADGYTRVATQGFVLTIR